MKQKFTKFGLLAAMLLAFLPASAYDFEVDGFYYEVVDFSELTCAIVSGDNKYEGDVIIPAELEFNNRKLKVTEIGSSAFEDCSSLTSVTIPNSVTIISWDAFNGCSSLTSVTIPNSVTFIGESAFEGCKSLTSVTIPDSVTGIGNSAFYDCSSLTSVIIPDSVTKIGVEAFQYCSSLKNITLSDNLNSIEYGTFDGCESLTSISIPGSVKTISQRYDDSYTFGGCDKLKSISFMYGESELVSGYQYYVPYRIEFSSCEWDSWTESLENVFIDRKLEYSLPVPNLKKLTIGEHLDGVQIEDISDCSKLETIFSNAMTPPYVSSEFSNAQYINLIVNVPNEALEAYQAHPVWKNFWNLQGFDASGIDDIEIDGAEKTVVGRYDLNGRPVNDDYKGMTIIRFSDGSTKKVVMQ